MKSLPRSCRLPAAVLGLLLAPKFGACSKTVAQPVATPSSPAASLEPAETTGTLASSVDEALSDPISEIEQDRDDEDIPGYAGVAVDAEDSALDLRWVGEPPNRIGQLIAAPPTAWWSGCSPPTTTTPRRVTPSTG